MTSLNHKTQTSNGVNGGTKQASKILDLLANNMPLGAVLLNSAGEVLFANTKAQSIAGYEYASNNKVLAGLFARFPEYNLEDRLRQCLAGSPSRIEEAETGGLIFEFQFHCLPAKDGGFYGHIIWIEDVTAERMLERTRDEFFALASHELRTPLSIVTWNASVILKFYSKGLDPEAADIMKDIQEAAMRMVRIVNDFLIVSSLEQNEFLFKRDKLDVVALINEILEGLRPMARKKGLYFEFSPPSGKPFQVIADKDRASQVLFNLLDNAITYTKEGGVKVEVREAGGFLEILVSDTGAGIPQESQKYLFRKFQQAEDRLYTKEVSKGTGLGLYISKSFAEKMGGTVKLVQSEKGKGSTFGFILPMA